MNAIKKIVGLIYLFFTVIGLYSQTLPPERSTNWEVAGLGISPYSITDTVNFLNEGGFANGSTPNDSVISALINSLNGDSTVIYFPNGTYYFTSPIIMEENIVLRGNGIGNSIFKFDLNGQYHLIYLGGASASTDTVEITSNLTKDSSRAETNGPNSLQVGDYVKIIENDASIITSSWALNSSGQIIKIKDIQSNTVFFGSAFRRDFSTSNDLKMVKLDLKTNMGIENLTINRLDITSGQKSNIFINNATNCWVKCIESTRCNFAHIEINNSTNVEVSGSYIHGAFDHGNGGKAYGVMAHFTSGECLITENQFDSLRHSMILQAGANGNVFSYNYSINPYWTDVSLPSNSAGDMVLHGNYAYANLFEGNTGQHIVIDDSHGINGPNNTFFRNRAELYGIFMNNNPASDGQNFLGNEITNSGLFMGNYFLSGSNHFEYGNNQLGNTVPAGTDVLTDSSLYLETSLPYYHNNPTWPPIGLPNIISSNNIEAEENHNAGTFTKCFELTIDTTDSNIIDTNIVSTYPNDFKDPFILLYPNPTKGKFSIVASPEMRTQIEKVELISNTGKLIDTFYKKDEITIAQYPAGIYFLRILFDKLPPINKLIVKN